MATNNKKSINISALLRTHAIKDTGIRIYETKNYDLFSFIDSNRPVNKNSAHYYKLKEAIKKKPLLIPMICNEILDIVDGQNRFEIRKELKLPVHFLIADGYGADEMRISNTYQRKWGKKEYLHSYVVDGVKSYILLDKYINDFPEFQFGGSEALLTQLYNGANKRQSIKGKPVMLHNFSEGGLKVKSIEDSYKYGNCIMKLKPHFKYFYEARFIRTMLKMFKNKSFDFDYFLRKVITYPTLMKKCPDTTAYLALIEEVYNFRNRNKVTLRF